jgi:hypothetical protein
MSHANRSSATPIRCRFVCRTRGSFGSANGAALGKSLMFPNILSLFFTGYRSCSV